MRTRSDRSTALVHVKNIDFVRSRDAFKGEHAGPQAEGAGKCVTGHVRNKLKSEIRNANKEMDQMVLVRSVRFFDPL